MGMNVNLTPQLEELVRSKVASGDITQHRARHPRRVAQRAEAAQRLAAKLGPQRYHAAAPPRLLRQTAPDQWGGRASRQASATSGSFNRPAEVPLKPGAFLRPCSESRLNQVEHRLKLIQRVDQLAQRLNPPFPSQRALLHRRRQRRAATRHPHQLSARRAHGHIGLRAMPPGQVIQRAV